MFYSQFILAKKGPLGTIWVAAHLERKLRKNQVADTDIGDSVDSIITPEVPIALRLSSHLLLGVVRIYSRKVNYLFDDCSETLLKVKQAFRAADVDLPPEETTAPYESITLPETFDLDDFELPDNEIFQGNQVDHHTSTMDQITLQDNMEGVVYSGSQFGLDDTFGDGENSSLNFDEQGLDLHKVDSTDHSAASSSHQVSAHVATPKQDEGSIEMPANNESMQIENLDLERDVRDYAQAPSTPGVVETPNIANVHEISACEDHMDDDDNHPLVVSVTNEIPETISGKSDHCQENAQPGLKSVDDKDLITVEKNGNQLFDLNVEKRFDSSDVGVQNISTDDPEAASRTFFSVADEAQALGQAPNSTKAQDLENMNLESDGVNGPSVSVEDHEERSRVISNERAQDASFSISSLHLPIGINDIDVSGNPNRPISTNGTLDLNFEHTDLSSIEKPEDVHVFNGAVFDERPRTQLHTLRPYMTGLELANDLDMSHIVGANPREFTGGGERFHGSGPAVVVQDNAWQHNPNENHTARGLIEDFQTGFGESYNQINNVVGGDSMLKNVSGPLGVIASAPEKQLPVIDAHYNQPPEKQLPVLDARYNQPKDLQEDTRMFNRALLDEMPRTQLRRPPRTGSELADSSHNMAPGVSTIPQKSHGGGEWIYASGPAVVVQDDALEHNLNKNHTAAPRSIEDIHAGYGKSYNQVNNAVGGDSMLKNVSDSVGSGFSAPENLMSVPYVYNNIQPRDLPEDTRMFNRPVFDEMARAQFPGGGERIHLAQPAVVLQGDVLKHNLNEKHTLGPRLSEDIHAGYGKSHSQVNNVGGDNSTFRNVSSSFGGVIYSAPEKQLSMHSNQPRELPGVIYPAPEKQLSMHSNQPRDLPGVIYPAPEKQISMHSNQPRDLPEDNHVFNGAVFNEMPRTQLHNLRPCRTGLEFTDSSHDMAPNVSAIPQESRGGGERIHASGPAAAAVQGPGSINDIRHGSSKTYNQVNYAAGGGDSMVRNVSGPLGAMFSAPEKLLSVPDVRNNQPRDLPVEATPRDMARLYENDASSQISSWKKRSYTESTQTEQSFNSVMSASVVSNKRPGEASSDEDYLSSILVGRGSSVLQVKSTPPPLPHPHHLPSPHPHHLPSPHPHHLPPPNPHHLPPPHPHHLPPPHPHHYQYPPPPHHLPPPHEITSVKRQRRGPQPNAPKASANKRKVPVLMDDMLVMHGDIIRQQLINTADIRRLRRKASSTRPENSVIIKLSLEEEILGEPLCSGTSVVLASLFSHSYNINRIKVSKDDGVSAISSSDKKFESVNESIHNLQRDTRYRGEYESVKENTDMHLNEVVLLTENKSDADNQVSVGPGVTNKKLDPTENKEIENEGVGAEASMERKTEAVLSYNAVTGSKNVSLNNSLFGNGSERNVNDVRLDMVKSGDTVTVNEVESNDNDTRGSKIAMLGTMSGDVVNEVESNERDDDVLLDGDDQCADTVETERLHSEQAQHDDDACGPSTEKKNDDASKGTNNEPLCGGGKSGGSTLVTSLYPPGFGTSGESTPVVASLYPPGFETSSGSSPVAASSYPPGFGTSSGSSPVVASSCPPGFGTSDGSPPVVTSSYPPGFSISDGSVPVVTADGSAPVVTADGSAPVVTADGSAPVVTADGSAPVATADGSAPVATADGSAPVVTADGSAPVATADGSAPVVTADGSAPVVTADGSAPVATADGSAPVVTSYPPGFGNVEDSVIDDKKSPIQDVNPTNTVGEESSDPDTQDYYDDINDPDDPDDADDTGFDTGFLNDDDDDDDYEVAEVADDDEPNGEATRITDNSGWSSRTRAVANYLQTVFMREVEYDKKVVPINDLLVGKTRKEACRMFFETLVLKTKDYVQVEQEGPFENIKVKPKMKLLKSEF